MAKFVYCSNCGTKSIIIRKAIVGYGRIINLVDPHECLEEPIELDLTPTEIPREASDQKFVQKLNELERPSVSTMDLRDRRKIEEVKTTAPFSVLEQVKHAVGSSPEGDISKEPANEE